MTPADERLALDVLERCFSGAIPAVLSTCSAEGVPNVTFLSKAHQVDAERIALSNQFMSKTARNLAANPRACLLMIDPATHDEFRLSLVYERTERRGHVFDRLRTEVDAVAAYSGMQDVFRLRAATIFRVVDIEPVKSSETGELPTAPSDERRPVASLAAVAELIARLGRCGDLDVLVDTVLDGLDQLLGFRHVSVLLVDETGQRLYTIGSRGFGVTGVGAEVEIGDGPIGTAAQRGRPLRVGNLRQAAKYSESIRRHFEDEGGMRPGREVRVPGLPGADSRLVVPAMSLGQLVGVIVAESPRPAAFGAADEQTLVAIAGTIANAVELLRANEGDESDARAVAPRSPAPTSSGEADAVVVRHFAVDGSTFIDGDYVIKGVAGRILRSLALLHSTEGRVDFTNRELRLDPTLELPGFKDNLESRLILLKRRLEERDSPLRLEKTGRGRFRLLAHRPVRLVEDGDAS